MKHRARTVGLVAVCATALTACAPSLVVRIEAPADVRLLHALVLADGEERALPLYGEAPNPLPASSTFGLALPGISGDEVTVCITAEVEGNRAIGCGTAALDEGEVVVQLCAQFQPGSLPPRGIAPMNASYLGSVHRPGTLRPDFRWGATELDGNPASVYEMRYFSDDEGMNDVRYVLTSGNAFTPDEDLLVSEAAPVGRRYFWQSRAAFDDGRCTGWSPRRYVDVGRSEADINGDGWDDVVIGAPALDIDGDTDAGAVYVFLGPITIAPGEMRSASTADIIYEGASAFDRFGESVTYLGDFNGDGYSDVAVGAPGAGQSAGTISVLFGAEFPEEVPRLDFVGMITGAEAGTEVSAAGDFDADGFADLAIGGPPGALGTSAAFVFRGNPARSTALVSFFGFGLPNDLFGQSLAAAGDINGDGFGDLIVGAPGTEVDGTPGADGAAYIYFGGLGIRSAFPDVQILAPAADLFYGWDVAGAGDMDGDGYGDIIIGGPGQSMMGPPGPQRIDIAYGSGSLGSDWTPDFTFEPAAVSGGFGFSLATGDANGDGCSDLAVGVPFAVNLADFGGAGAFLAFPCERVVEAAPEELVSEEVVGPATLGFVVSFVDWNGDGLDDMVLGAPGVGGAGPASAGKVFLFASDGATPAPGMAVAPSFLGTGMNDRFGAALAHR